MAEIRNLDIRHKGVVAVGTDGSEAATRAVSYAASEAMTRGSKLLIVHSWFIPNFGYGSAYVAPINEIEIAAQEVVDKAVEGTKTAFPGLEIEGRLLEGTPGVRLIEEADKEADIVVIGTRGHGSFTSLLLGSVSAYVLHHSKIPVLLIRPEPSH